VLFEVRSTEVWRGWNLKGLLPADIHSSLTAGLVMLAVTDVLLRRFLEGEDERGFHDLLRQKPTSLYLLLGWSSISIASLTMQSMYRVLLARIEVS
jgi:hypothetical protein